MQDANFDADPGFEDVEGKESGADLEDDGEYKDEDWDGDDMEDDELDETAGPSGPSKSTEAGSDLKSKFEYWEALEKRKKCDCLRRLRQ